MRARRICIFLTITVNLLIVSCRPDVTCPNPKKDANKLFDNASKGKSTQKAKTDNGLIKKKNPNKKKKR